MKRIIWTIGIIIAFSVSDACEAYAFTQYHYSLPSRTDYDLSCIFDFIIWIVGMGLIKEKS